MRDEHLLRALQRVGDVEIFTFGDIDEQRRTAASERFGVPVRGGRSTQRSWPTSILRYLAHWDLPLRLARLDVGADLKEIQDVEPPLDLIFCRQASTFILIRSMGNVAIVTDLDDLESELVAQQRRLGGRHRPTPGGSRASLRRALRAIFWMFEERKWRCAERRAARRSNLAFVCSDADASGHGLGGDLHVVPNGIQRVAERVDHLEVSEPPTVTFWGLMAYLPNRDGAEWFVTEIWPRILDQRPDARARLVGMGADRLGWAAPGIEVDGFVPDLNPILAESDVAVVPLRLGGGTRIKIIEAWAHGIPVVSTAIGAHGLATPGSEAVLIADSAKEFADEVAKLLVNSEIRARMIAAGLTRAHEFEWDNIEALAAKLIGSTLRVASE